MAERLHFNTGMTYESMLAAEHLARYWLLKDVCKGKRVLDVACGEGYGSSLLKSWGATSVVGIDISQDAIGNANERFGAPGILYRQGDACDLESLLSADEQFDLIVSFETIEHVPDVPNLLRGIRSRLAPGGTIAISCPNDPEVRGDERSEFHLRTYTLPEFQEATVDVLGEAVQWLLGTPVIGFGVCDSTDRWAQGAGSRLSAMLQGSDAGLSRFLPAQAGHEIDASKAHFYIGVWGTPLTRALVAAPIAYRAYVGPWNGWVAAQAENKRLLAERASEQEGQAAAMAAQADEFDAERQRLGQRAEVLQDKLDACLSEASATKKLAEASLEQHLNVLGQLQDEHRRELLRLESEIGTYKIQIASERSARLLLASRLYERDMRHQHMTDNLRHQQQRAAGLEDALGRLDQMQGALAGLEAERNALSERLHVVLSSRGWRAVQGYYRLYGHAATRWFMRPARRVAARVRRALR